MWVWFPGPALPILVITSPASTRTRRGSRRSIAARSRSSSQASPNVEANVRQGRLAFAGNAVGVAEADGVMIAVGTPSRRGDGHADLSFVFEAVREIAPLLSRTAIVVTKSTVPVGTGDEIERILRDKRPDAEMQVVSNPEFLREGAAIQDFKHPDRIVVGTRRRAGAHGAGRALPAALPERRADPLREPPDRRADQIWVQRLSRHQDHLHQRDRRL